MLEANTLILSDTKSERGRAPLLAPDLWSCCSAASTAWGGQGLRAFLRATASESQISSSFA